MRTLIKRYYRKYKVRKADKVYNSIELDLPNNYKRIYHVHIRKSAGTSINSAFWAMGNLNLKKINREPLCIGKGNLVFVRNNKPFIEKGNYFYGNSHIPFWNLNIPEDTFTFCVLRDPYKRLVSLYKYYLWVAKTPKDIAINQEPYYHTLIKHIGWLGESFSDFLDNSPKKNIANQLYMFSENYNVEEALENIYKLNKVYFQENFDEAIKDLSSLLFLPIKTKNERNFGGVNFSISEDEKQKAMDLLENEYVFFNIVKNLNN